MVAARQDSEAQASGTGGREPRAPLQIWLPPLLNQDLSLVEVPRENRPQSEKDCLSQSRQERQEWLASTSRSSNLKASPGVFRVLLCFPPCPFPAWRSLRLGMRNFRFRVETWSEIIGPRFPVATRVRSPHRQRPPHGAQGRGTAMRSTSLTSHHAGAEPDWTLGPAPASACAKSTVTDRGPAR